MSNRKQVWVSMDMYNVLTQEAKKNDVSIPRASKDVATVFQNAKAIEEKLGYDFKTGRQRGKLFKLI